MKSLIYILGFVILLTACKKDDPAPKYNTLEGNWSFQNKTMSASFRIQSSAGDFVVTSGEYTINDANNKPQKFLVGTQFKLGNPITEIRLIEGTSTKFMLIKVSSVTDNAIITTENIQSNSITGLTVSSFDPTTITRTQ